MKKLVKFGVLGAIIGFVVMIAIILIMYGLVAFASAGFGYPLSFVDFFKMDDLPLNVIIFRDFSYLAILAGLVVGLIIEKFSRK